MTTTYPSVTDRIVAMLENGTRPWSRPWTSESPISAPLARPLRVNGQAYTGANVLNLWAAASVRGFSSRYWMTFKAAKEMGAHVRKGARAELAFYVGQHGVQKEGEAEKASASFRSFAPITCSMPMRLRACPRAISATLRLFSCRRQRACSMLTALLMAPVPRSRTAEIGPITCLQWTRCRMPHFEQFRRPEGYYSVLLHELTHWTGHANRCARDLSGRFGNEAYAVEEHVAELGAAFLCADLAISAGTARGSRQLYRVLDQGQPNDNRAIFRAAALAEKAAGFLHGCQPDRLAEAAD